MTNLDSILKSRDVTLPAKVHLVKAMVFPVVFYVHESWTIKKAELSFHLAYSFLHCAKAFKFNWVPFVYFCFYFHYSGSWVIEDLAVIYVSVLPMFSFKSFIVSFIVQKLLSLIGPHLFIFALNSITLGGGS